MDVNDFMARLAANATPTGKVQRFQEARRTLEKIFLSVPDNFGSYQLLPVCNTLTDYPFVNLPGTREVCVPRKRVTQDGKEEEYSMWIKILPKSAYIMKDLTGRVVSSLTAEDESLLEAAYSVWDQIRDEMMNGASTDEQKNVAYGVMKNLVRKRNYTIFNAYCLNRWEMNSTKQPVRSNFSGLFVSTASGFSSSLKADVDQKSLMYGGSAEYLKEIYSSEKTGRTGSLFLTINRPQGQTTYNISFNHTPGVQSLASVEIPEADFELMKDPLETFLGFQARRDQEEVPVGERRLFNPTIIREAISYMTRQLAAIRMAKQNNTDIAEAINATNAAALAEATAAKATATKDPMLAEATNATAAGETYEVNAERLTEANTNPFQTPPAARMNPITGEPVTETVTPGFGSNPAAAQSAPFAQPGFGFGTGAATTANPFATPAAGNDEMPF